MIIGMTPRQRAVAFMAVLARGEEGFLELRHRRHASGRVVQRFFHAVQPNAAASVANVLSRTGDVFVGCVLRTKREGCKDAVPHGRVLWVDCDDPSAIEALGRFEPRPAIVVRSSPRGLHAYWPLQTSLPSGELEQANRRLAHALGACESAVTNVAAVLRPPNTLNWKYQPTAPVTIERLTRETFIAEEVAGRLPEPPVPPARCEPLPRARRRAGDRLLAIEPAVYIECLTGRHVGRDRKVPCPFHPDRHPSLHVYPDHWTCYSAKCWRGDRPNGGDIYNLAGQLWGLSTKSDFVELRRRLDARFSP